MYMAPWITDRLASINCNAAMKDGKNNLSDALVGHR